MSRNFHGFDILPIALAMTLAACGGSSSETPPPLEPDPHALPPPPPSARPEVKKEGESQGKDEPPASAAPGTWGSKGSERPAPTQNAPENATPE